VRRPYSAGGHGHPPAGLGARGRDAAEGFEEVVGGLETVGGLLAKEAMDDRSEEHTSELQSLS
jgi:hypothetical protein